MAAPLMTADQFASVWGAEGGSPTAVAKAIGMTERGVYARRAATARGHARRVEPQRDPAIGSRTQKSRHPAKGDGHSEVYKR